MARLVERHRARLRKGKERALVDELTVGGRRLVLAVPVTYMNDSGQSVVQLVRRHGVDDLRRLVVVHDELDLPTGRVRVKVGGGTAGHNGLESLKAHLHDTGFVRVRIGIDKAPGRMAGADWVLRRPGKAERESLDVAVEIAADAVEAILADGPDAAMNRFNALD